MATHDSYHDAQLLIDEKIADLTAHTQQAIRLLKTHRNELAPVSKLPNEILQHIFLVWRDLAYFDPKDWYQVTHIYRHWRCVAVGSPLLWTRLYATPPALTQLMLERSQSAPLEVELKMDSKSKHAISALPIILRELKRIRTLTLSWMPVSILDTINDILAGLGRDWEASLLESLCIHTDFKSGPRPTSVKILTDVIRPTRLLRNLSLTNGYYNWDTLPLPSLTHLNLHAEPLGEVSGAQFMETLRHMQNLEDLKLRWESFNIGQFPPIPRPQPIHLPSLRKLDIWDGNEAHLQSFLSLVTHPKLHQLNVNPCSYTVIDIVTFTKSVLRSIGKANFEPLEYLRIELGWITISRPPKASIYTDNDESSADFFLHAEGEQNDILNGGTPFEYIVDFMPCLTSLDYMDRIPLRRICLDSTDAPIGEFTRLFASLPHLETIEVHHKLALVLFKALNITSTADGAIPATSIPFPNLRTIIWHHHPYKAAAPLLSSTTFSDLYSGLLSRHVGGVPITRLELGICEVFDDIQNSQLKEIGVEVVILEEEEY
ncbi:hypothetical protein D9619_010037 [Psilocybe cf. subviscida]|uniref:F-box domain-containing protein n=1 Tax=Psilocybe cf. subviscida TaxID=2480587 RepID=A0A8H5F642_9AGAR|nr:hypothetical protein D9619_010037 [Psilocybe cf. subviscida]